MQDIAVIGGGPVGLCAALALQHPARRVSVIEAADLRRPEPGGLNARSIALAWSSRQIFRALGVWPAIEAAAAPIRRIHVSARGRWGVTRLDADDYGLDALGYVIESRVLLDCLLAAVDAVAEIDLVEGAEFAAIRVGDAVEVDYRRESATRTVCARLALVADGAQSAARAALGIGHETRDYGQSVLICNIEAGAARDAHAYERFTPSGPLALLPLGGRRYACVWTLAPETAAAVAGLDDDDFCAALQQAFGYRLGRIERAGERFALPIRRTRAERLFSGRCIVVGNAANALHPVAGQGFNLALRDIAWLYETLCEESLAELDTAGIEDIGNAYQAARDAEQLRVIRYGDGLVSLFSNSLPLLDTARAAGLGLLDLLPALKAQVTMSGMGMAFGGNRLLRGHR